MRTANLGFLVFSVVTFALGAAACGGSTATTTDPATQSPGAGPGGVTGGGGGEETETISLPNVGRPDAMRVIDRRSGDGIPAVSAFYGQTKMTKVSQLLKLNAATETKEIDNCAPAVEVEFLAGAGVKGKLKLSCYGDNGDKFRGTLVVGEKLYATDVAMADVQALTAIEPDTDLLANYLFEVSRVSIRARDSETATDISDRAGIDKVVGSLSASGLIDPNAPQTKCAADYSVTFQRMLGDGPATESQLFIQCGSTPTTSEPAWFQATEAIRGQVTVNAKTIVDLAR